LKGPHSTTFSYTKNVVFDERQRRLNRALSSTLSGPDSAALRRTVWLLCYAHEVSPAELSHNARWENGGVVPAKGQSIPQLPCPFLFSFSSPYLGYPRLLVFFGLDQTHGHVVGA